jgi:hypothetical protein
LLGCFAQQVRLAIHAPGESQELAIASEHADFDRRCPQVNGSELSRGHQNQRTGNGQALSMRMNSLYLEGEAI